MASKLRSATRRPWLGYTAIGFGATAAYFVVADWQNALYVLVGASAAAAIGIGRRLHASHQRGWLLMAAGVALLTLGDLVYTIIVLTTGEEPFPSVADVPYFAGQVLVVVGIGRLAAPIERGFYRPALLDAALVTVAGLFVAWPLLLDPMAADQVDPFSGTLAVAYPLLDLVLVGVLTRHILQPGQKSASLLLMICGAGVWLAVDLIYARLSWSGEYVSGMWLDAGWLIGYVLLGASALHPSIARLVAVREEHEATISNRRLLLIGVVVMIPAVAFAVHGPPTHAVDLPVFAIGSLALLILWTFRLLGALHASRIVLGEQRALEAELARRARTDRLTGLANRAAIMDRLTVARDESEHVGLVYLDLDDFKRVNDAFGHPIGEDVLREVGQRLRSVATDPDDVAHIGGDEFAIVVRPCPDASTATRVAQQVMDALEPEVSLGGHRFRIQASIGIVWSSSEALTADELLSRADIAMYEAKGRGGGGYALFESEMHDRAVLRTSLQNDLEGAVERGEIEAWFQPIYDVSTEALVGVEALARWQHPTRGLIAPDEFIPIAELSGVIAGIDRHIVHVATRHVAEWNRVLGSTLQVHVNITPREATDPNTVGAIASALGESGVPAGSLVIEVTETALIDEAAVTPVLTSLKALGVRLSVDDFGSQYAVLTQLGRLPIDIVKLDRSVLAGAVTPLGLRLFQGILRLAQSLQLETVAEGVESRDSLSLLRELGCNAAQGFALGRPMPAEVFTRVVILQSEVAAIA